MKEAASDARKRATSAISFGLPIRPSGWNFTIFCLLAAFFATPRQNRGVSIYPGEMAFTRTPSLPGPTAIARVNPMRADFAASYAAQRGHETRAWTEEMLIIEPPRRRISRMEYLEKRNTPLILTAN